MIYQWSLHQSCEETPELTWEESVTETALWGDPLRIQQIMTNLLNNSVESATGDRQFHISIHIARAGSQDLSILVKDNGRGIPANEQELIFERFYRGIDKQERVRGLGLGLSFSRLLATNMGGHLRLIETSTAGSTFELQLPLKS